MNRLQRLRRAPLLLALIALAIAQLPSAAVAQNAPRDVRFGAVQSINAPQRAVEAGVGWERIIFPWAQMQPNSPFQMLPGYYSDAEIDAQAKRGVSLVGVVLYTPDWATTDLSRGGSAVPRGLDRPIDDAGNFWASFMSKLALKYRGKVDTWIIWNEPDLIHLDSKESPTWAGSESDYGKLLKSAYLAVKRVNPNARVLTAGFSYWHAREAGLEPYLKRLLDALATDPAAARNNWYFDGVPVHPYSNPLNSFTLPLVMQRILAERGLQKPVWNVESNAVPWDDPIAPLSRLPFRVTMEEQASYVITGFALGLAASVERMSIYKLRDEAPENGQYFGLVREDGSPRPAFTALKTAIRYFSGARSAAYTWEGSGSPASPQALATLLESNTDRHQFIWPAAIHQVAIERDGQRVTVVWNTSQRPLRALVSAAAEGATLVDALGRTSELRAVDGAYRVYLDAARGNTDPRDPSLILNTGRPLLVVEKVGPGAPPSQPPRSAEALCYPETGFCLANGSFEEHYLRYGGARTFGLPISREVDLLGAPAQIFQRHVLRLRAPGEVETLSLMEPETMPFTRFGGLTVPASDERLRAQAPKPTDRDFLPRAVKFAREQTPDLWGGRRVEFGKSYFSTVACADAFPTGACNEEQRAAMNFEVWGLPTSAPALEPTNNDFAYQRYQRGVLHWNAACGCVQGLLMGEQFRALISGQGIPPELEEQVAGSPYFKQYDQARGNGLARPGALPRSSFKDAFERHF